MNHFKFLEKSTKDDNHEKRIESSAMIANIQHHCKSPLSGKSFHIVDRAFKAHLNVYFTDKEFDADILVYVSHYAFRAKGREEVWHYSEQACTADTMIYPVDKPFMADVKVCIVEDEFKARWIKKRRLKARKKQFN